VRQHRKIKTLGLIVILLAVLLGLAFASYHPSDDPVSRQLPLLEALWAPQQHQAVYRIQNALGLVGAEIARRFLRGFIGYPILIVTGVAAVWGGILVRHRAMSSSALRRFMRGSGLALVGSFLLSALLGWMHHTWGGAFLDVGAGHWGLGLAGALQAVVGSVASLLVILLFGALGLLVAFDLDLQRSARRLTHRGRQILEHASSLAGRLRAALQRIQGAGPGGSRPASKSLPEPPAALPQASDASRALPAPSASEPPPSPQAPAVSTDDPAPAPNSSPNASTEGASQGEDVAPSELRADAPDGLDPAPAPLSLDLLPASSRTTGPLPEDVDAQQQRMLGTLSAYNVGIAEVETVVGPSVIRYVLTPASRTTVRHIQALEDDLAIDIGVDGLRMVAPLPGTSRVAIELPSPVRRPVALRGLIDTPAFRASARRLPLTFGRALGGDAVVEDLAALPHLLTAGAPGSGRVAGLQALLLGLLYAHGPERPRLVFVDAAHDAALPFARLRSAVPASDSETPAPPSHVLEAGLQEMEARYALLDAAGAPDRAAYNEQVDAGALSPDDGHRPLPLLVLVVADLAALMADANANAKTALPRLAHSAPTVGMHLIVSTSDPSAVALPEPLKAAIPHRVAYALPSRADSRTVLDQRGAEVLLGDGDLLYRSRPTPMRLQGPTVAPDVVRRVVEAVAERSLEAPYALPGLDTDPPLHS
jgi:S-DNA-T family DNA segregation ATPase FtsK/SpoIIIE